MEKTRAERRAVIVADVVDNSMTLGHAKREAVGRLEGRWDETVAYNFATGYYSVTCDAVEAAWKAAGRK